MKKVVLTKFEIENLIYAINLNIDLLEGSDGVKREVNSLHKCLEKLGGKRERT